MRLVKGLDWKTQQQRVIDYIATQGYLHHQRPARQANSSRAPTRGFRIP
jgi:hypothetical protein